MIDLRIVSELPKKFWSELKEYQFNDLKESKDRDITKLKNSIVNEGFAFPFYCWQRYVIDGKGRFLALTELEKEGYDIPPLPYIELKANSIKEAKKLVLMASSEHGKISQNSFDKFTEEEFEIEELKNDINIPDIKLDIKPELYEEEDEIEEEIDSVVNTEINTLPGDLWELNQHKILCGNVLTDLPLLMGSTKAEMIFADPPYNLPINSIANFDKTRHSEFKQGHGEMNSKDFTSFLQAVFKNLSNSSIDGSIHYVCIDWRHIQEMLDAGNFCYSELKNLCVWTKDLPGMGNFYRSQHELIFVWKNGKEKNINNFELGQFGRNRSNVWQYPSALSFANPDRTQKDNKIALGELKNHPTPKPVELVQDCCLDCSNHGGVILDPFLGSGTSLIAAQKTERVLYGMDIEPRYIDSAIRRWIRMVDNPVIKKNGDLVDI